MYKVLCEYRVSVLLCMYLCVELLSHIINRFLAFFLENATLFSRMVAPLYISISSG